MSGVTVDTTAELARLRELEDAVRELLDGDAMTVYASAWEFHAGAGYDGSDGEGWAARLSALVRTPTFPAGGADA